MFLFRWYLKQTLRALRQKHAPIWSWIKWRYVCRCGREMADHEKLNLDYWR